MYAVELPNSDILREHIKSICILLPFDDCISYYAFPQVGTTLGIYSRATIESDKRQIHLANNNFECPSIILLTKYLQPIRISYERYTPEISINFSPTGQHYFDLGITPNMGLVNHLKLTEKLKNMIQYCFSIDNKNAIVAAIEEILLEIYRPLSIKFLDKALAMVSENANLELQEIALEVGASEKTLSRYFDKYVGCTFTAFKKIIRFRKAVDCLYKNPNNTLTNAGLSSFYYDSPHFSKEFKRLTNMSPKQFFGSTDAISTLNFPYLFK